jgi:hypothetical protein
VNWLLSVLRRHLEARSLVGEKFQRLGDVIVVVRRQTRLTRSVTVRHVNTVKLTDLLPILGTGIEDLTVAAGSAVEWFDLPRHLRLSTEACAVDVHHQLRLAARLPTHH